MFELCMNNIMVLHAVDNPGFTRKRQTHTFSCMMRGSNHYLICRIVTCIKWITLRGYTMLILCGFLESTLQLVNTRSEQLVFPVDAQSIIVVNRVKRRLAFLSKMYEVHLQTLKSITLGVAYKILMSIMILKQFYVICLNAGCKNMS